MGLRQPSAELRQRDRREDVDLLIRKLRRGGLDFISRHVETGAEFAAALDSFAPDLILSDYTLPSYDGKTVDALVETFDIDGVELRITLKRGNSLYPHDAARAIDPAAMGR